MHLNLQEGHFMRNHRALAVGFAVAFLPLLFSTAGFAVEIGAMNPKYWQGNGARVFEWPTPDLSSRVEWATDQKTFQDATTRADYLSAAGAQSVEAMGQSRYKELKGLVSASGYSGVWEAGGYYRDEIFFSTANGQPADLALTFNISATGSTHASDNASALLTIGWGTYYGIVSYRDLGAETPISLSGPNASVVFDDQVTLRTSKLGHLVASDRYVAFSVGVWGKVNEGSLDWSHTAGFVGYSAFQDGIRLAPDQFTIVEGVGVPAIPEPETYAMFLAGLGMIGAIARRRKCND
jgi:hypothetical protein